MIGATLATVNVTNSVWTVHNFTFILARFATNLTACLGFRIFDIAGFTNAMSIREWCVLLTEPILVHIFTDGGILVAWCFHTLSVAQSNKQKFRVATRERGKKKAILTRNWVGIYIFRSYRTDMDCWCSSSECHKLYGYLHSWPMHWMRTKHTRPTRMFCWTTFLLLFCWLEWRNSGSNIRYGFWNVFFLCDDVVWIYELQYDYSFNKTLIILLCLYLSAFGYGCHLKIVLESIVVWVSILVQSISNW